MRIEDAVVVITGATGAIGRALALALAKRRVHGLALVDQSPDVAGLVKAVNECAGDWVSFGYRGEIRDASFRRSVYEETRRHCGTVNVCVPIIAMANAVEGDRHSGTAFAPIQAAMEAEAAIAWALEMMGGLPAHGATRNPNEWKATERGRGMIIFVRPFLPVALHTPLGVEGEVRWKRVVHLLRRAEREGIRCRVVSGDVEDGWGDTEIAEERARSLKEFQARRPLPSQLIADAICLMVSEGNPGGAASASPGEPQRGSTTGEC